MAAFPASGASATLHATCVAFQGHGVVIAGASGAGKSDLALRLIALGADLVSDDRTRITRVDGALQAHAPAVMAGVIEARGVGLLRAPGVAQARVRLLVDLDRGECERLPHDHVTCLLGIDVETIYRVETPGFPAAIMLLVSRGRHQ